MWEQNDYSYDGEHFTVPTPHNILPKPYGKGHPPIWVACGNPPTFETGGRARHRRHRVQLRADLHPARAASTPTRRASPTAPSPIGQFKNDNVMITNSVICCETREEAREIALRNGRGYLVSMVNLYHDTMPKSQDGITWPSRRCR